MDTISDVEQAQAEVASDFLSAMANPKRLLILRVLVEGEIAVGALANQVGLSQSALSQHLARLREDGLVAARREGVAVFYSIANPAALKVIGVLAEIYCPPSS